MEFFVLAVSGLLNVQVGWRLSGLWASNIQQHLGHSSTIFLPLFFGWLGSRAIVCAFRYSSG